MDAQPENVVVQPRAKDYERSHCEAQAELRKNPDMAGNPNQAGEQRRKDLVHMNDPPRH